MVFEELHVVSRNTTDLVSGSPDSVSQCSGSSGESWGQGIMKVGHYTLKLSAFIDSFRVPAEEDSISSGF